MSGFGGLVEWGEAYARASVQAGVLIVLVVVAQRLFRRWLTPGWQNAFWLLVLVRLTVVYAPPSAWSWESWVDRGWHGWAHLGSEAAPAVKARAAESADHRPPSRPSLVEPTAVDGAGVPPAVGLDAPGSASVPRAGSMMARWRHGWVGLWIAVAGLLGARLVAANVWFRRELRRARRLEAPGLRELVSDCARRLQLSREVWILESARVSGPCLFGLWRARVLLPVGLVKRMSTEELRHVLLHEMAHVRRRDLWVQAWFAWMTCLHWFNPLVWWAAKRSRRDRELACDATVLASVGEPVGPEYGRTILKLVSGEGADSSSWMVAGILEDRTELRRRMRLIGEYGLTRGSTTIACGLVVLLGLLGWTGRADGGGGSELVPLDLTSAMDYPVGGGETVAGYTAPDVAGTFGLAPRGTRKFQGVPFEVEGLIRLAGQMVVRNGWRFRESSGAIPVGRKFGRLYLLHGTYYGGQEDELISRIWIRYVDGQSVSLDVRFGRHVRNWHRQKHDYPVNVADPDSRVVWTGQDLRDAVYGKSLRLFASSWVNPRPQVEVTGLEVVSAVGLPTHVILGMTVGGERLPEEWRNEPKRDEEEYPPKRVLVFRAVDSTSGQPIAGCVLDFEASQERSHFWLGRFVTDAAGRAELRYPDGDFRYGDIWVAKDGYVPKLVHWETREDGPFPPEYVYRAEPGQPMRGRVVTSSGAPLAGVTVRISGPPLRIADGVKEHLALSARQVTTGTDGTWEYRGLPADLAGSAEILVSIQAPDFAPWQSSAAMLRDEPVATLEPVARVPAIHGWVVDEAGRGVMARVRLGAPNGRVDLGERTMRTDGQGRFRFPDVPLASSYAVSVVAEGYAPQHLQVERGAVEAELKVVVSAGRAIEGEVVDPLGRPVEGARIRLVSWGGLIQVPESVVTDSRGRFRWAHAPTEGWSALFSVEHEAYLPGWMNAPSRASAVGPLATPVAETLRPVVRLTPRLQLDFDVVRTGTSQPIVHGRVLGERADQDGDLDVLGVVNGGRCSLVLPGDGGDGRFRVVADGYEPAEVRVTRHAGHSVARVAMKPSGVTPK